MFYTHFEYSCVHLHDAKKNTFFTVIFRTPVWKMDESYMEIFCKFLNQTKIIGIFN